MDPNSLQKDDIQILLQMALLIHSLSTRQNKLLGSFLKPLFKKIEENTKEKI